MSDEVDEVVAAWARERGDLELGPMQIWSRIDRLSAILADHRKRAFTKYHIEGWEFDVLAALRRAGEPYRLSPGQLIRETHVTSGTMTNRVDRLVARGLVRRDPDPHDGRGMLVTLTHEGLTLVDAALSTLLDTEAEMLDGWSAGDRERFAGYLRTLLLGSD